ncbi:hypothetical protein DFH08DRAFT_849140, partial [Mycena albidolilacea]
MLCRRGFNYSSICLLLTTLFGGYHPNSRAGFWLAYFCNPAGAPSCSISWWIQLEHPHGWRLATIW